MNRNRMSPLSEQLRALGTESAAAFSMDHLDLVNRLQLYDELAPAAYTEIGRALLEVKKLTKDIPSEELAMLADGSIRQLREVETAALGEEELLISRFRSTQRGYSLQKTLVLLKRELSACDGLEKEERKLILERVTYASKVLDQLIDILG
jgi:transcriptional regulator of met regulon